MKRDIRELFKGEEGVLHDLPKNHRDEFLDKLKSSESKIPKKSKPSKNLFWFKVAAVFIVTLTVGFGVFNTEDIEEEPSQLIAQVEEIEQHYLENIHAEWLSFIKLTKDENLVKRYKERLDVLDKSYQEFSGAFKQDPNNILVVESLIQNLQTRLQLLKDIQEHIKILNQKNEHNENTI